MYDSCCWVLNFALALKALFIAGSEFEVEASSISTENGVADRCASVKAPIQIRIAVLVVPLHVGQLFTLVATRCM